MYYSVSPSILGQGSRVNEICSSIRKSILIEIDERGQGKPSQGTASKNPAKCQETGPALFAIDLNFNMIFDLMISIN